MDLERHLKQVEQNKRIYEAFRQECLQAMKCLEALGFVPAPEIESDALILVQKYRKPPIEVLIQLEERELYVSESIQSGSCACSVFDLLTPEERRKDPEMKSASDEIARVMGRKRWSKVLWKAAMERDYESALVILRVQIQVIGLAWRKYGERILQRFQECCLGEI